MTTKKEPPAPKPPRPIDFSRYQRVHIAFKLAYNGASYDGLTMQQQTKNTVEEHLLKACVRLRFIPNMYPDEITDAPFTGIAPLVKEATNTNNSSNNNNNDDDANNTSSNKAMMSVDDDGEGEIPAANCSASNMASSTHDDRGMAAAIAKWIGLARCGRTDKGVSALGNCVSMYVRGAQVETDNSKESNNESAQNNTNKQPLYDKLLNRTLPPSIRIIGWAIVPDSFDARFSCTARSYRYFFDGVGLDLGRMAAAAKLLEGLHDFRNLCWMDVVTVTNFERIVHSANIHDSTTGAEIAPATPGSAFTKQPTHQMCFLHIRANAFLYHQIRCVMSVLLTVGSGNEMPDLVSYLLDIAACPRKPIYTLADPLPLVLWECEFGEQSGKKGAIAKWSSDSAAHEEMLVEFAREADAARVRAAVCGSMVQSIRSAGAGGAADAAAASSVNYATQSLMLGVDSNNRPAKYIPFAKRQKEKSYEEKVAALSQTRQARMKGNQALAAAGPSSIATAARRQRDEDGDD